MAQLASLTKFLRSDKTGVIELISRDSRTRFRLMRRLPRERTVKAPRLKALVWNGKFGEREYLGLLKSSGSMVRLGLAPMLGQKNVLIC